VDKRRRRATPRSDCSNARAPSVSEKRERWMVGLSSSGRKQEGDNGVMASEWPYPARGLQRSRSCCLLVAAANASPGVRLGLAECWAAVLLSACSEHSTAHLRFGGASR
jgi:hypothetical protein